MANIHSILPLLAQDSWEWGKDEIVDEKVLAGRSEDLFNASGVPGFLYYGIVIVQGPDGERTEVEIDLDNFQLQTTIEEAYTVGSTQVGAVSPGIARYDTENDLYAVTYEPSPPLAYISNARIQITAPSETDIRVNSDALRLDITDRESFRRSYQQATLSALFEGFDEIASELNDTNRNIEELLEAIQGTVGNRI